MAQTKTKSTSSVQSPLETYLREINETALLTAQGERDLASGASETSEDEVAPEAKDAPEPTADSE